MTLRLKELPNLALPDPLIELISNEVTKNKPSKQGYKAFSIRFNVVDANHEEAATSPAIELRFERTAIGFQLVYILDLEEAGQMYPWFKLANMLIGLDKRCVPQYGWQDEQTSSSLNQIELIALAYRYSTGVYKVEVNFEW